MVSRGNGDVIISFMAYSEAALQDLNLIPQIPHLPIHPQVDRLNTIVAKLHLAANASGLHAWVDRHEALGFTPGWGPLKLSEECVRLLTRSARFGVVRCDAHKTAMETSPRPRRTWASLACRC